MTLRQSEGMKRAAGPPVGPGVKAQGMTTWAVGSESAPGLRTSGPFRSPCRVATGGSRESLSPAPGAEETWASGPHAGLGTHTSGRKDRSRLSVVSSRQDAQTPPSSLALTASVLPGGRAPPSPSLPRGLATQFSLLSAPGTQSQEIYLS